MKLASDAIMIRPRYLPHSFVVRKVSISEFLHSLDPEQSFVMVAHHISRYKTQVLSVIERGRLSPRRAQQSAKSTSFGRNPRVEAISSVEEGSDIDARSLADSVVMPFEPSACGLASDVAKMDEECPFGVELARGRERRHLLNRIDPV